MRTIRPSLAIGAGTILLLSVVLAGLRLSGAQCPGRRPVGRRARPARASPAVGAAPPRPRARRRPRPGERAAARRRRRRRRSTTRRSSGPARSSSRSAMSPRPSPRPATGSARWAATSARRRREPATTSRTPASPTASRSTAGRTRSTCCAASTARPTGRHRADRRGRRHRPDRRPRRRIRNLRASETALQESRQRDAVSDMLEIESQLTNVRGRDRAAQRRSSSDLEDRATTRRWPPRSASRSSPSEVATEDWDPGGRRRGDGEPRRPPPGAHHGRDLVRDRVAADPARARRRQPVAYRGPASSPPDALRRMTGRRPGTRLPTPSTPPADGAVTPADRGIAGPTGAVAPWPRGSGLRAWHHPRMTDQAERYDRIAARL